MSVSIHMALTLSDKRQCWHIKDKWFGSLLVKLPSGECNRLLSGPMLTRYRSPYGVNKPQWAFVEWDFIESLLTTMRSTNASIFRVTGHLWGEFTATGKLWCFLWPASEQTPEQTIETPVIWDAIALTGQWWLLCLRTTYRFAKVRA